MAHPQAELEELLSGAQNRLQALQHARILMYEAVQESGSGEYFLMQAIAVEPDLPRERWKRWTVDLREDPGVLGLVSPETLTWEDARSIMSARLPVYAVYDGGRQLELGFDPRTNAWTGRLRRSLDRFMRRGMSFTGILLEAEWGLSALRNWELVRVHEDQEQPPRSTGRYWMFQSLDRDTSQMMLLRLRSDSEMGEAITWAHYSLLPEESTSRAHSAFADRPRELLPAERTTASYSASEFTEFRGIAFPSRVCWGGNVGSKGTGLLAYEEVDPSERSDDHFSTRVPPPEIRDEEVLVLDELTSEFVSMGAPLSPTLERMIPRRSGTNDDRANPAGDAMRWRWGLLGALAFVVLAVMARRRIS